MYKHILVPTDGSELSSEAVNSAIALAKTLGAQMTFLFVQPDYPSPIVGEGAIIAPESREEFIRETQEQARAILEDARELAQASGVSAQVHSVVGDSPYTVIVATAESCECDLVFMASHGRKGLANLLLGSETQKVLTHCKIPVLVYRSA